MRAAEEGMIVKLEASAGSSIQRIGLLKHPILREYDLLSAVGPHVM
jgi:hypothetical protein